MQGGKKESVRMVGHREGKVKERRETGISFRNYSMGVFKNIHISHQCLQMVSSKAHVQLTPFSLQESLTLHKNSLEANTTQMMDSRLERQS